MNATEQLVLTIGHSTHTPETFLGLLRMHGVGAVADVRSSPFSRFNPQFNREAPWDRIDMDFMNLNQAAHGDREFGYIQTRLGVARKTVAGHVSNPGVRARISVWARAAIGYAELRTLRLARFGDNMRDVAVTETASTLRDLERAGWTAHW